MRSLIPAGAAAMGLVALVALPLGASRAEEPAAIVLAAVPGGDAPEVGSIVNHKFNQSPMNAGGLTDLADFRGRPLLIEYWGTR